MPSAVFEIIRKCPICGKEFFAKQVCSVYCSPACSRKAYKKRQVQQQKAKQLDKVVKGIDDRYDFIKVSEAYALFGISTDTIYRLIRANEIFHVNLGEKQIRVRKSELMKMYPLRRKADEKPRVPAKLYSLEEKDCYSIGEITDKFRVSEKSVYDHIRKYSIPTRQIGRFVYAPKDEIDKLYK